MNIGFARRLGGRRGARRPAHRASSALAGAARRRRVVPRDRDRARSHAAACPRRARSSASRGASASATGSRSRARNRPSACCWSARPRADLLHAGHPDRGDLRKESLARRAPASASCSPPGARHRARQPAVPRRRDRGAPALILLSTAAIGVAYLGMAVGADAARRVPVLGPRRRPATASSGSPSMTALQEATPRDYQARVVGLLESLGAAMPGVGFLLGGVIATAARRAPPTRWRTASWCCVIAAVACGSAPATHSRLTRIRPRSRPLTHRPPMRARSRSRPASARPRR